MVMSTEISKFVWSCALLCVLLARSTNAIPAETIPQSAPLLGLPPLQTHDVADADKARLGARLFADTRLSSDGRVSCASCHVANHSFADTVPRSKGRAGLEGMRNAPSLLNVAYMRPLFWDGRAPDLASQARAPFTNPVEHGLADEGELVRIVRADGRYAADFARLFDAPPAALRVEMIAATLVAFEQTLLAGNSAFDRFVYGGEVSALSAAGKRGLELFKGRARCSECHLIGADSSLLTDQQFHVAARGIAPDVTRNLAALTTRVVATKRAGGPELEKLIATDRQVAALGRFVATLTPSDIGKFKTPSLRNVALTAPYMHDGGVATLSEAVDLELYGRGAVTRPIILTRAERHDVLEFLRALSSPRRVDSTSDVP